MTTRRAPNHTLLVTGGRVIDPTQALDGEMDALISDGRIAKLGQRLTANGARRLDAHGCLVLPGLVDVHTHLRQPGREDAETIATGMQAAAKGGFTTICAMPNTTPAIDSPGLVEFIVTEAQKSPEAIHVHPLGAVTRRREGKELTAMADLAAAGVVAFSDDGNSIADAGLMRRALEYAKWLSKPIVSHAEDPALAQGGVMHEGIVATILGLRGIPASAETVMVARDVELAAATGSHVHIAHVSTAGAVALIRDAKRRGIQVTCETCPHYFTLTDEAVKGYRTEAKMNPPLRSDVDRQAIIEGLCDGTIDMIATDHAPHPAWEKAVEFDHAPFGIIGLETAVGLAIAQLVQPERLSWHRLVELMSVNPAQTFRLPGGTLTPGSPADITLIDPQTTWTVRETDFRSKSRNSPFLGWQLQGQVVATLCEGRLVYQANGGTR